MDFLLCVLVIKTNKGPSFWHEKIMNFQNMNEIIEIIFNNNEYTQQLVLEESIISFLYNSKFPIKLNNDILNTYYFAPNAKEFILHFFDTSLLIFPNEAKKMEAKKSKKLIAIKQLTDNAYTSNLKILDKERAFNAFGKTLYDGNFRNPNYVLEYFFLQNDDEEIDINIIRQQSEKHFIPYLDLILNLFDHDVICDFFMTNINHQKNIIALIKTFKNHSIDLCQKKFIRNLPHPVFAEVFFQQ